MNKMKKLLSVLLAVVLALSCMSVTASAAKTAYKTTDELSALDAYSPYGQVTRLSLEERTSIVLDFLDNVLPSLNINMGEVFNVLGLSVTIDLTSVDRLCYSIDTIKDTFTNTLASIAMAIVDLGILESLEIDSWATGMSRDGTAQFTILSEVFELLSANTTLVGKVFTDGLDLGLVNLGDTSAVDKIIGDLPGLVKGLVFPMLERWDDTLAEVKWLDEKGKGDGYVEEVVDTFVGNLFTQDMSITTIKYDATGKMTSEHTNWVATATGSAAPSESSPRCYYQFSSTTPGSVMTVYHLVDEKEAEALAKAPDKVNGSPAAYTYFKEEQTFVMTQEVEGSDTYVWKATDDWGNTWSLKWYNDNSPLLPGFDGDDFDLRNMTAVDLLYTFIPVVFENMAPVVLNGSLKKILAEFFGAKFTRVGEVGSEEVNALADASNTFFTEEQGEYLWEWSNYAVINGTHYYRFQDDIYVGDISKKNNYFDIINWGYEITDDFLDEFIPNINGTTASAENTVLDSLNNFLIKVAEEITVASAETADTATDYTKTWTRPDFVEGGNENLVNNIKMAAQAVISLAPQHIFGSDYATNERCYYDLLMSTDNDTVLTGIAAMLVDIIMPSMTLPGKSDILSSGAKVGAILAAVVREFAAYLAPEYNFDALIYTSFENGEKKFVTGKDSGYWFDVILTMGINVGFEYLRAFADMGEGTTEWTAFCSAVGYAPDGKTYAAGTTQEALNAEWEGMLDYIIDWALATDKEWTWKMGNLVDTTGLTINLATAEDPWVKLQQILGTLLPVDQVLTVTPTDCDTKMEQFLRYDLILGIVDLEWDALIDTLNVPGAYFRTGNILDQLAALLKQVVNGLFKKAGGGSYELIPSVITDFDSLANQNNLITMVKALVGVIYKAFVTNGLADTVFPFLNFLLGWKTDPQKIADPQIWTQFRDNNDYAYQWTGQDGYPAIDSTSTKIKLLNNSAGMLEIHRNSSVTDHAYDMNIKSVTSDATVNTLTFTYDNVVSPWETIDIQIGGTYKGDEAVTVTIAYDYVGKDGTAIGGTQYTSVSFLISNLYEDSNLSTCLANDHDDDYTGLTDVKGYVFTEDLFDTVTNYEAEIHYVSASFSNPSKDFVSCQPEGYTKDCNGNVTAEGKVPTAPASNYFAQYMGRDGGWASTLSKNGTSSTRAKLYYAKSGVTEETEFAYGAYDMGELGVKYGSDTKVIIVDFIYYNDYDIDKIYTENKNNGYNSYQGVDSATWEAYRTAWNKIVYLATYPMMTTSRSSANWEGVTSAGTASNDYVSAIMPQIEPAIEAYEAAKEAYETALAEAQASATGEADALPGFITEMETEIDNDFVNGKEINFQDYNFYEYFNYNDVKVGAENLYRSYLRPEVMDTYYILNSGIREAELNFVIANEDNATKQAAITASRLENDADAISASQAAHDDWVAPVTTELIADDFTSRLAYYKQFLAPNSEAADHKKFLDKEIAFVEAQGLVEEDYEAVSWGRYAEALAEAKAVADGTDEFAGYNSRIYDVKYNLMVAYKQLLAKDNSLIEAGGTADLLVNIEAAEAILAKTVEELELSDEAVAAGMTKDEALAQLIESLGYYYQARYSKHDKEVQNGTKTAGELKYNDDGSPMMFNLYADSAYEYADNDRPNKTGNQAKVDTCNAALETAIANFKSAEAPAPEFTAKDDNTGAFGNISTDENGFETGFVYGVVAGDDDMTLYFTVENGTFEMVANEGGYTNGTGATVVVKNLEGVAVAEYTLVIFGDVNGDAQVTGADGSTVTLAGVGATINGDANNYAADVNGDGSITGADGSTVTLAGLGGDITVNPYAA